MNTKDHKEYQELLVYYSNLIKIAGVDNKSPEDSFASIRSRLGDHAASVNQHINYVKGQIRSYRRVRSFIPEYNPVKRKAMLYAEAANRMIETRASYTVEMNSTGPKIEKTGYQAFLITIPYSWIKLARDGMAKVEGSFILWAQPYTTGHIRTYKAKRLIITGRASYDKSMEIEECWIGVAGDGDNKVAALGATMGRAVGAVERRLVNKVNARISENDNGAT